MCIEGNEVVDTHIGEFFDGVGTVKGFPSAALMLPAFIKEGHDDINTVCLAIYSGDHSF